MRFQRHDIIETIVFKTYGNLYNYIERAHFYR